MNRDKRIRVLIVASHCDRDDVGESFNAFKWVTGLSQCCDVTLITQFRPGRQRPSAQIPDAQVIEWPELSWFRRFERFNAMAKPWYPHFYWRARSEIKKLLAEGHRFDVIHHLVPIAIRYPSPCTGFSVPYIVGPLSGGVRTPGGFGKEIESAPLYTRLRSLDGARLRWDPFLRRSFSNAAMVLGAAPYVADLLAEVPIRRFEVECEVGIDGFANDAEKACSSGPLKMLYVGRAIRTKGLRDAVRGLARVPADCEVVLTAAGDGEDLDACKREAELLGVSGKITFLGKVDRQEVERQYSTHDVFIFPSFREPTGGVILEAMRHGLPIIAADAGGPGFIVTDDSGIRVLAHDPSEMADALAAAICRLSSDCALRTRLGEGALKRVEEIGLWPKKIDRMIRRYRVLAGL